jgi:hypothetical protein
MLLPRNANDPNHWRERAAQMRALALSVKEPRGDHPNDDLAADYDKLADRASTKANGRKPPSNGQPR